MSTIKNVEQARHDVDKLLREAIAHCCPDRPRRWLAKYGSGLAERHDPLAEHYRALRREAENLLTRTRTESENGLASHLFHLE